MSDPSPADPEQLLEHVGWVQSLARRLVADQNQADDLAQETFLAWLMRPPTKSSPTQGQKGDGSKGDGSKGDGSRSEGGIN